jgi:hypothetical protein
MGGGGEGNGFERKPDWIILDFAQNWVLRRIRGAIEDVNVGL